MIEHRNLVASIIARKSYYDSYKSLLLIPSFSFDPSVGAVFGTFLTGGTLILCQDELIKDISFLRKVLRKVQTVLCVPSYYGLLLTEGLVEKSALSRVILGGENLDKQIVSQHYSTTNNIELYNEYGPTENTIWTTVAKIDRGYTHVTIGKPISNTRIYIAGKEGQQNPIGIFGEICIAGDGLARGYLNNDELTSHRFVSNPYTTEPGARMYKTGDLGRWLPDGDLEFIGRVDDQVKIMGYRIELGEVENVLQKCEEVKQAVVLAVEDKEGGKRLAGYVVPHRGKLDPEVLTEYLSSRLPQYMIPAMWVEMDQFPLTANGKVDRKALADLGARNEVSGNEYKLPSNEVQSDLCAIWQDLFGIKR
jgi:amino acid adenylation domain-containing protein